jgi:exopolysaccharide biosynthesis polyprenyl glycosylphosphotransferase
VARPRALWRGFILGITAVDALALLAAFTLAYFARFKTGFPLLEIPPYSGAFYSSLAFWSVPIWLVLFALFGLYNRRLLFNGSQEYTRVANACTIGLVAEVMFSFLDVHLQISRGWLLLTWVLSIVLVCLGRFAARRTMRQLRLAGYFRSPAAIIGTNEEAHALAEQLQADSAVGPDLIGFINAAASAETPVSSRLGVIGTLDSVTETIERLQISEVIVAATAVTRDQLLDLYRTVGQDPNVQLHLSSGLFEILTTGMHVQEISRVPLMTPERVRITGLDAILKTVIDYAVAASALVLLSPIMLLIALLVRLDSYGPIIHRRRVMGVSGATFDAFKFRTMIVNAERRRGDKPIPFPDRRLKFKSEHDPRVTRIGRLLRRTSLDELPQLLNVLRGEMSLVGPRMIAPTEQARYGKWQHNLLTVKPGITGPWQVQGRGDIPYEERVRLSMQYILNHTLWLDIEILFRTVFVVFKGGGAY